MHVFVLKSPCSFPVLPPFRVMILNLVMNLIKWSISLYRKKKTDAQIHNISEGFWVPWSPWADYLGAHGHLVTKSYATTLLLEILTLSFLRLYFEKSAALTHFKRLSHLLSFKCIFKMRRWRSPRGWREIVLNASNQTLSITHNITRNWAIGLQKDRTHVTDTWEYI